MKNKKTDILLDNKIFLWIAVATIILLFIPLTAMQLTQEVDWDILDFSVMGILIFGISSLFVLTARKVKTTSNRIAVGIVFLLAFLYLWAELAVGIFTNLGS